MEILRKPALTAAAVTLVGATLSAQTRFELIAEHEIPDVSTLRIVTIRDNQLSTCYTLFVAQSVAAPSPTTEAAIPGPTPIDESTRQSVQRIREAAETRDRQLAELMSSRTVYGFGDFGAAQAKHEFDRARVPIEEEYERVLRAEIPGSYNWTSMFPGVRSGGFEDPANAIRRAIVDPDPTSTMKTMGDQLAQLDGLLRRLIEEPRLAVAGPVTCAAASAGTTTPQP